MKRLAWVLVPCTGVLLGGCDDGGTSRHSVQPMESAGAVPQKKEAQDAAEGAKETSDNTPKPSDSVDGFRVLEPVVGQVAPAVTDAPRKGTAFVVPDLLLAMLWCPPGTFHMGSPEDEGSRDLDEVRHEVTLTSGFWLGQLEVTQAQWEKIMGNNPSHFKGPGLPVEKMSWAAARTFCEKLTERERKAGRLSEGWAYQLPTEAQWEYACRADANTAWSFGNSPKEISRYVNFADKNSNLQGAQKEYDDGFEYTAPVGSFTANAWGFHEMHGNVFEWCSDWYGKHGPEAARDPSGPQAGTERVFRGGCWALPKVFSRSARRDKNLPILESGFLGFRVSLGPPQTQK